MSKTFLITTPLYPAGRALNLGDYYTAAYGDAIARYKRTLGQEVTALTGTNEQGPPAGGAARLHAAWAELGVDYSTFLSTAGPEHEASLLDLFHRIERSRFVSKGQFSGALCARCETISTTGTCSDCGGPLESVAEECYVFRLFDFQEKLIGFYQDNPDFVLPQTRMNEVVSQVRAGLQNICISRSSGGSGIKVPGKDKQAFTAWFSGLAGYLTGSGFPNLGQHARFWPADVQLVGREALRTHAIYWPALLMAAGLEPPIHIVCQGAWEPNRESAYLAGRQSVPGAEVAAVLPADYVKYFLLREMPFGSDTSFSYETALDRVNSDLATEFMNLASRVLKMIENYSENTVPEFGDLEAADENLRKFCVETVQLYKESFERLHVSRALETVSELVSVTAKYIVANEPWVLARDRSKKERLKTILYCSAEALRIVCVMLWPVVPAGASSVLTCLRGEEASPPGGFGWGELRPGTKMANLGPVFPRIDRRSFESRLELSRQREGAVMEQEKPAGSAVPQNEQQRISIEDFAKVEMKVGKIVAAERVPQSEKLVKLQVDIGNEVRQVVAGIGKAYTPEALVGRQVVVVTNLKPAKLMGLVSDGMIVAASQGGVPVLVGFTEPVEIGVRLK